MSRKLTFALNIKPTAMQKSKLIRKDSLEYKGSAIAINIYAELKFGHRYSLRGHQMTVRIPGPGLTEKLLAEHIEKAKAWLINEIDKNPALQTVIAQPEYTDGQILTVGAHQYTLLITHNATSSHTAKRHGTVITLDINANDTPSGIRAAHTALISRMVASHQGHEFIRRVHELNELYFKVPIAGVKFKYNTTNWGSCSSSGNLNFSTRLFFAPQIVKDSVIIHELAHRIEMNHGERFWAIIAQCDPDYTAHDVFLKKHSNQYKF